MASYSGCEAISTKYCATASGTIMTITIATNATKFLTYSVPLGRRFHRNRGDEAPSAGAFLLRWLRPYQRFGAAADLRGERHRAAGPAAHMNGGQLAHRGELVAFGVVHLVHENHLALSDADEARANLDQIAGVELAFIGNVLLHAGHAVVRFANVAWRNADRGHQMPRCFIEFADVPHDVHMAHLIALRRVDHAAVRDDCLQGSPRTAFSHAAPPPAR